MTPPPYISPPKFNKKENILLWLSIKISYEIVNIFLNANLNCNYEGHNILLSESVAHTSYNQKGPSREI